MKYAYNILINFKTELINFYEWEKTDKIKKIKKIPLIKINEDLFDNILNKNIKIKKEILNHINVDNEYNCIFANDYDTICVKFNDKGEIKKLSKLSLEDESDILDYIFKLKVFPVDYEVINKNSFAYSPLTRKEQNIINSIKKELEKIKNNKKVIKYLYDEWFNETSNNSYSYEKLIEDISKDYSTEHKEFYNIIKLITCKNV